MGRYIRTKDTEYGAIIDTEKYKEITGEECYIPKDEIVKQADTIKELCDEFVVAYESWGKIVYRYLDVAKRKAKESLEYGYKSIIYGAIWTDKGLIFVAKMNEEGELELL